MKDLSTILLTKILRATVEHLQEAQKSTRLAQACGNSSACFWRRV
jgi:hypothetical protein